MFSFCNRPQRRFPALAEGRHAQRAFQLIARWFRQIQQSVNVCHGDAFGAICHFYNFVPGADFSFFQHAKVEARPVMGHKQSSHGRLCHSDAHAIACDPRLSNLEEGASNSVVIANANLIVG